MVSSIALNQYQNKLNQKDVNKKKNDQNLKELSDMIMKKSIISEGPTSGMCSFVSEYRQSDTPQKPHI
jgi:hypothetical protein